MVSTSWIIGTVGAWVQICELRPSRKALKVQLLGGACVLAVNTSAPLVTNEFGTMPAALWHSLDNGNGPATFSLSSEIDGDLVTQAWWAWVIASAVPVPLPVNQLVLFGAGAGQTWTVPAGVTAVVDMWGWGAGGRGGACGAWGG